MKVVRALFLSFLALGLFFGFQGMSLYAQSGISEVATSSSNSQKCFLPPLRSQQFVYQVCPDLRVTKAELICMRLILDDRNWPRTDRNIELAFSNCWVIENGGFDTPVPNLEDLIEIFLREQGILKP